MRVGWFCVGEKECLRAKARHFWVVFGPTKELAEKSLNHEEIIPRRLEPDLFLNTYVRAKARTLQSQSFSASCSRALTQSISLWG